jgi:hypothetical protein
LKVRADDGNTATIDITNKTEIQFEHGMFWQKINVNADSLLPGLQIEARGKAAENGELVTTRVIFDEDSRTVSRQMMRASIRWRHGQANWKHVLGTWKVEPAKSKILKNRSERTSPQRAN